MQHSASEENYLKAIYSLANAGTSVSTTTIAQRMQTKASSVTDMLRKLAEKGLVNYVKYKGVSLTDEGQRAALRTIRKHRLWETFLVEKLGFGWDEVHEVAEQLEHIQSSKLTNSLAAFLENPSYDPHGDPIPDADGNLPNTNLKPLADCEPGDAVSLQRVKDGNPEFLQFLEKHKLGLGETFTLKAVHSFDNSVEIIRQNQQPLSLSEIVSNRLFVAVL
jgi:DtxR family Mn-dependent transcriptional regulator